MGVMMEKAAKPGDGDQNAEHLLGGVGRGGHDVRRQDGERRRLAQSLAVEVVADQRRAREHALDAVAPALGQVGGDRRVGPRGRPGEVVDRLVGRRVPLWSPCRAWLRSSARLPGANRGLAAAQTGGVHRVAHGGQLLGRLPEGCRRLRVPGAARRPRHPGWAVEPTEARRADVLARSHRRRGGGAQDGEGAARRRLPERGPGHPPELAAQAAVAEGCTAPRQVAPRPAGVRREGLRRAVQRPAGAG